MLKEKEERKSEKDEIECDYKSDKRTAGVHVNDVRNCVKIEV